MRVIVNPGTHDVEGTEKQAWNNIGGFAELLAEDLAIEIEVKRYPKKDYGGGRYAFLLIANGHSHEVQMPGNEWGLISGKTAENIFQRPRLYIDGNSWLLEYALDMCDFGLEDNE